VVPGTATEDSDRSGGKRSPQAAERESSRIGMRDPCNGNHARSRSPVPELSSDIIAERRDVLAQGIQFADLARKICESATDAIDVDSLVFGIDRRECFVEYRPEIHSRTENPLRGSIHPTATSSGLSRPKPVTKERVRLLFPARPQTPRNVAGLLCDRCTI
jgi:hypothetical protein